MLAQVADEAVDAERDWDQAYLQHLLSKAANAVKQDLHPQTWEAFWRTSFEKESPQSVAQDLQMSVAAVYMAKRRVLKRIEKHIAFLEGETI